MIKTIIVIAVMFIITGGFLTGISNQTTGQVTQGNIATSAAPANLDCALVNQWTNINAGFVAFGKDAQNGHKASLLTGKMVNGITFYLCASRWFTNNTGCVGPGHGCCPLPANDTQSATIGIFNANTAALVQSYGTVGIQSMPCFCNQAGTCPTNSQPFTFSGSHVMQANEMIGLTFSFTQDLVWSMSAGLALGTENPTGGIVDCNPSCATTLGFGLAGPFTYLGIRNTNVTSSPGLPSIEPAIPLFAPVAAVGLAIVEYRRKGGSTL